MVSAQFARADLLHARHRARGIVHRVQHSRRNERRAAPGRGDDAVRGRPVPLRPARDPWHVRRRLDTVRPAPQREDALIAMKKPEPSLRIVQVCPYSWDVPGGVQVHVRELSAHLRERGHEVFILAPGRHSGKRDDAWIVGRAIPVRGNGSVARISFGPQVAMVVARALKEARPDIIHVHEPLVPSVSMHAVLNATVPVVATFHSNVGRERMSSVWFRLAAPMVRPVWNRIARRIAVSDAARHSVTSRMGDDELLIVPNGVDVKRFAAAKAAKLSAGRHLLFVGRLEERKGFRIAVEAFAQLAAAYADLRLLVVGDGSERDAVDDLEPSVRSRVEMLGRVDDDRLASYLRAADLYIGPATGGESF